MNILGLALLAVLVIAVGVALAPHVFALGAVALILGIAALGLVLVLGVAGKGEARFARWYDTTRMARWIAGPPITSLTSPGEHAARDTDSIPQSEESGR